MTFDEFITEAKSAAWQRKEGKNKSGGLNEKGRKSGTIGADMVTAYNLKEVLIFS